MLGWRSVELWHEGPAEDAGGGGEGLKKLIDQRDTEMAAGKEW